MNQQPPDLDQILSDFIRKIKKTIAPNQPGNLPPASASFSWSRVGFVLAILLLVWGLSGFYIVREGKVAVVTQFGKYHRTVPPGFQWHIPYPIQSAEIVDISKVRSFNVGYRENTRNKILPEALMLTEDENIVDIQFDVQYRLKPELGVEDHYSPAAGYLFSSKNPDDAVRQAAESAMREVVGKQSMNKILYESRVAAALQVKQLMQTILDRYHIGIEITSVAIQNVQPPEQVQAAFEDAIKAGQDNEKQKNEGNAYASKVIPEAQGQASRMIQNAQGYAATVMGKAKGETSRFEQLLAEYSKAPEVTRQRLYIATMEEIYARTPKVMLDTQNKTNILNVPAVPQTSIPAASTQLKGVTE